MTREPTDILRIDATAALERTLERDELDRPAAGELEGDLVARRQPRDGSRCRKGALAVWSLVAVVTGLAAIGATPAAAQDDVPFLPMASLRIAGGEARVGQENLAEVEVLIQADAPVRSVSLAIDFDERSLLLRSVEEVSRQFEDGEPSPAGIPIELAALIDNGGALAEDNLVDEGFVVIQVEPAEDAPDLGLPLGEETPLVVLRFEVREEALLGCSPIQFADIGPLDFGMFPVFARTLVEFVENEGDAVEPPGALDGDALQDGGLQIIGEIGFFLRGDVDMNCVREISDPIRTLNYLFGGTPEPPCLDACDSDDNGQVELADVVFTLDWLFHHGPAFSEPYEFPLRDPTDLDSLDCVDGYTLPTACGDLDAAVPPEGGGDPCPQP